MKKEKESEEGDVSDNHTSREGRKKKERRKDGDQERGKRKEEGEALLLNLHY